jgi:hypothetical protein
VSFSGTSLSGSGGHNSVTFTAYTPSTTSNMTDAIPGSQRTFVCNTTTGNQTITVSYSALGSSVGAWSLQHNITVNLQIYNPPF